MNTKDFKHITPHGQHELPHRTMSRAPSSHNLTAALLGCLVAAAIFAGLWALYAYSS